MSMDGGANNVNGWGANNACYPAWGANNVKGWGANNVNEWSANNVNG